MIIHLKWQDQHSKGHHYQSKQNQADAYRIAEQHGEKHVDHIRTTFNPTHSEKAGDMNNKFK